MQLETGLKFLLPTLVSEINGCAFCLDLARAMAIRDYVD